MKILCDMHHDSLFRSLVMLFEERLGIEVYRPIGLEWYREGFWNVWNHIDTANQYLSLDQTFAPSDGSVPLNRLAEVQSNPEGVYSLKDMRDYTRPQRGCTLDYFIDARFDYILASIPAHIEPFSRLAAATGAKLIVQAGNEWPTYLFEGHNFLASVAPRPVPQGTNAVFYHQEFCQKAFRYEPHVRDFGPYNIASFINLLGSTSGWRDFMMLESRIEDANFSSFGGQCRDGCIDGVDKLGEAMRACDLIFHVKDSGDGYGHILHNAYSVGRPIITRKNHYVGRWGEALMVSGTYINLDDYSNSLDAADAIHRVLRDEELHARMCEASRSRFEQVVNFDAEEQEIRRWLERV